MRATASGDYALRTLILAGLKAPESVTVQEIADRYGISRSHLTKVVWKLGREGLIATTRGPAGGLRLALPPERINLGQVLRAFEDDRALVECFSAAGACAITPACAARRIYREAMEAFYAVFERHSLADLLARRPGLAAALGLPEG